MLKEDDTLGSPEEETRSSLRRSEFIGLSFKSVNINIWNWLTHDYFECFRSEAASAAVPGRFSIAEFFCNNDIDVY